MIKFGFVKYLTLTLAFMPFSPWHWL